MIIIQIIQIQIIQILNPPTPVMNNSNNNMHYYNELANIEHLDNLNGYKATFDHNQARTLVYIGVRVGGNV
jgi:hypothetical protein